MSTDSPRLILSGQSLLRRDPRAESHAGLARLRDIIRSADIAFTNFEGVIRGGQGSWVTKEHFIHDAPPGAMAGLHDLGFRLLSLANNHAFDLGPAGVLHSLATARSAGLLTAGAGATLSAAGEPAVIRFGQRTVALIAMDASGLPDLAYARDADHKLPARPGLNSLRIRRTIELPPDRYRELQQLSGELGEAERQQRRLAMGYPQAASDDRLNFYGAWIKSGELVAEAFEPDPADLERNIESIARAAQQFDLVLVYVHQHHWSPNWQETPEWLRRIGRDCIDAGAGAFISHGVPMLLDIDFHRGCPLFLGLGSLFFDTRRQGRYTESRFWQSILVEWEPFAAEIAIRILPLVLDFDQFSTPRPAEPDEQADILSRLQDLSPSVRIEPQSGQWAQVLPRAPGT